jgi:hypothetical protein
MAKQRRGKLPRVLYTILGVATQAYPIAKKPLVPFVFGTATQPQSLDVTSTLPPLPQTNIENIIDHLQDRPADLRACSLVSRNWKTKSQSHLFRRVGWTTETVLAWCKCIPPHSDGPAGLTNVLLVASLWSTTSCVSSKVILRRFGT